MAKDKTYYKLTIIKEDEVWTCALIKTDEEILNYDIIDIAEANSYAELQIEMGNKSFIDIINKND